MFSGERPAMTEEQPLLGDASNSVNDLESVQRVGTSPVSGSSDFNEDEAIHPTFYPQQEDYDHLQGKTFKRITIRDPNDNNRDITDEIRMRFSYQQPVTENLAPKAPVPIKITAPKQMEPDTDPSSETQRLKKKFPMSRGQLLFCIPPEGQEMQQNKEELNKDFQPTKILQRTEKHPFCILVEKEEELANKADSTAQPSSNQQTMDTASETDGNISPKVNITAGDLMSEPATSASAENITD